MEYVKKTLFESYTVVLLVPLPAHTQADQIRSDQIRLPVTRGRNATRMLGRRVKSLIYVDDICLRSKEFVISRVDPHVE